MPLAEYAGFVLNLNRKQDIEKLQKLQNRALRLCFNVYNPRDVSVADLHDRANLDTLCIRRELKLLGLMYDISNNPSYILAPRANTRQAEKMLSLLILLDMIFTKDHPIMLAVTSGIHYLQLSRKIQVDLTSSQRYERYIITITLDNTQPCKSCHMALSHAPV